MERKDSPTQKKENVFLSLAINLLIPTFILMKLSSPEWLGPVWSLVIGLAFPLVYGVYDLIDRKKANLFSIVGVIAILLLGVISLMELDPFWVAVSEAAKPFIFALAFLFSMFTNSPLIERLFLNDQVVKLEKINAILTERNHLGEFNRVLKQANLLLVGSFLLSTVLNFVVARWIVKSPAGTPEFTAELGEMQLWSFPVIVVPTSIISLAAFYYMYLGLKRLTSLSLEEILNIPEENKK